LISGIIPVVIAVLLFGVAISDLGDEVKCGNRAMKPGDTCRVTSNGSTHLYGYTAKRNDQRSEAKWYILAGLGMLGAAGWAVAKQYRRP
jgi:hypothetical protein